MRKYLNLRELIALGLIFAFLVNILGPLPTAQAQEFSLPAPGVMVRLSPEFNPPILKGIKVHPDNPFRFDFILDQGDENDRHPERSEGSQKEQLRSEATKLIKYFLASLTIPEKDLWVNLSPYEKNRIVPESFGQTEMGRDLLAEDYMLKQITASLIYPEDAIGKKFWKRIYEEAAKKFGTTNIPVNTFNKVWIVPEKAVVYENAKAGTAYVVESKLKVMLEQDYLALSHNVIPAKAGPHTGHSQELGIQDTSALGNQIVRELIIPELTKEINEGKNFAQLRQVYNSLILATWYKKKIKDSILEQVYADKKKITGVEYTNSVIARSEGTSDAAISDTERIYQRYLQAFKKGAYNYIKEEINPVTQQSMPRKYFSGGFFGAEIDHAMAITDHLDDSAMTGIKNEVLIKARFDNAMLTGQQVIQARSDKHIDQIIQAWVHDGEEEIALTASDGAVFKFKHQMQKGQRTTDHRIDAFLDDRKIGYVHFMTLHDLNRPGIALMKAAFQPYSRTDQYDGYGDAIFVEPETRSSSLGRYKGVGASLLGLAERLAFNEGAGKFSAEAVSERNFNNFYKKLGYHKVGLDRIYDNYLLVDKKLDPTTFSKLGITYQAQISQHIDHAMTATPKTEDRELLRLFSERILSMLKGDKNGKLLFKNQIISLKGLGFAEHGGFLVDESLYDPRIKEFNRFNQVFHQQFLIKDFNARRLYKQLALEGTIDYQTFYARALFLKFFGPDYESVKAAPPIVSGRGGKLELPRGYWGNELTMSPVEIAKGRLKIQKSYTLENETEFFSKATEEAIAFLKRNNQECRYPIAVVVIPGEEETFGITLVTYSQGSNQGDVVYIEKPLFNKYKNMEDAEAWLTKLLVYVLPKGLSYKSRKVLEFDYAREVFGYPETRAYLGVDYLLQFGRIMKEILERIDEPIERIRTRVYEALWPIAVSHLNGDINKEQAEEAIKNIKVEDIIAGLSLDRAMAAVPRGTKPDAAMMGMNDADLVNALKEILALIEHAPDPSEENFYYVQGLLNERLYRVYNNYPNAFYRSEVIYGAKKGKFLLRIFPKQVPAFITNLKRLVNDQKDRENDIEKPVPTQDSKQGYMPGYHDDTAMPKEVEDFVRHWPSTMPIMSQHILLSMLEGTSTKSELTEDVRRAFEFLKPILDESGNFKGIIFEQIKHDMGHDRVKDTAMNASPTGGIDLSSDKALSVQSNGQGIKFHIDPAQLEQLQNAPGFVPVIINIQPMYNLREFLGLHDVPTT